jgi:hypothetical protein
LQEVVDRTVVPVCAHEFCFDCLIVWTGESPSLGFPAAGLIAYSLTHRPIPALSPLLTGDRHLPNPQNSLALRLSETLLKSTTHIACSSATSPTTSKPCPSTSATRIA